jgi:hypothetical protein
VVDEQILTGVLGGNKSVSLGVVEPLDSSSCHRKKHLLYQFTNGSGGAIANQLLALDNPV